MKKLTFLILFAASAVFSAKADLTFTIDLEDWSDVGSNLYVSVAYNTSGTWQGWKDRTQATYLGGNCYSYTISESGTISGWQA
ncbi:MAG: hypothetical protein LBS50_09200, partial [Prevotellaceae bacterium]|nr:hypothetical protein [Prevotellaceae bacterium]